MPDLPAGTVTFLFTDIEGSTALLHRLGDGYAEVLAEHRRILRAAFAANDGVEVDTQGDAFFVAFARASDALAAAAAAQAALAGGPVAVRMGVHTGEPQRTAEGYVGMDVHTAARIAAGAHGGQVVLSRRTREFASGEDMTDLGEHRLKDLDGPIHLFQLGTGRFPPLRTVGATNLPEPVSSFVGRDAELAAAARLLAESRFLTITGAGGTGKTRFAIALARARLDDFPDGVWWVPLADLRDPDLVLGEVERAIGARVDLARHVGTRRMLIVLDNFEQVIAAAPELPRMLAACPNLRAIVTSRERLRVEGEHEFALASMSVHESVELFCERAGSVPDGPVKDLCARLDGLPLAIELAAARSSLLTVEQMLARLAQRLDLFSGSRDADPRHATLRATIEWSHDLLDPGERRLFARSAVFAGGATFEALEAVAEATPDGCQSLLQKSLTRRTGGRLWMLETIREFALERLEQEPDACGLRARHARYYLTLAESLNLSDHATGTSQYGIGTAEYANFRGALTWAVASGETELGLRMTTALENLWALTEPLEAIRWLDQFLARADRVPAAVLAAAVRARGSVASQAGDDDLAERMYAQSLAMYREIGDEAGVAGAVIRLGHSSWYRGDLEQAIALGREGLDGARRVGNARTEAQALGLLGELECERANHPAGVALLAESAAVAAACDFRWWQARMLLRMGKRLREAGRPEEAERTAREGLSLAVDLADRRRILQLLDLLAVLAAERGDRDRAAVLRAAVEAELAERPIPALVLTEVGDATAVTGITGPGPDLAMGIDQAVGYALGEDT